MSELPCIKCGAAPAVISGLCEGCFREDTELCRFPVSVKATVCMNCGAYASRSRWVRASTREDVLEARIMEGTEVAERPGFSFVYNWTDPNLTKVDVEFSAHVEGVKLTENTTVIAKIKHGICDACSRRSGAYFEAIIQLRATDRKIDADEKERAEGIIQNIVAKAAERNDGAFITMAEEVRGGYDYYISQRALGEKIGKDLASVFGAAHRSSPSLAGRKDGKDLYRITHMVRLPFYRAGDFVSLPGNLSGAARDAKQRPFWVVSITGHHVLLRQLLTGDERKLNRNDMESARVVARREDVQSAVVVSEGKELVQVMHPTSFRTVDVNRPDYEVVVEEGNTDVLVLDETIYILFSE